MLGTAGATPGTVAVSPRDHGSLLAAADDLAARGWRLCRLPLAADGSTLEAAVRLAGSTSGRMLVSTTLVCGQTGLRESLAAVACLRSARVAPPRAEASSLRVSEAWFAPVERDASMKLFRALIEPVIVGAMGVLLRW